MRSIAFIGAKALGAKTMMSGEAETGETPVIRACTSSETPLLSNACSRLVSGEIPTKRIRIALPKVRTDLKKLVLVSRNRVGLPAEKRRPSRLPHPSALASAPRVAFLIFDFAYRALASRRYI